MTNLFENAIVLLSKAGGEQVVQTTLRIPEEMYKQIKRQAKERGMTVNGYIIAVLCEKEIVKV